MHHESSDGGRMDKWHDTGAIWDGSYLQGDEAALLRALREGDERAFGVLVDRYHLPLLRYARAHVRNPAVAEELVQDTWLALVQGIGRFQGRSTLKTWLFHVLAHKVSERVRHDVRLPSSPLLDEPAVAPERFQDERGRWPGHWATPPPDWSSLPDEHVAERELLDQIERLIAGLPPRQRTVLILRDIEGLSSADVCQVLGVTDGGERVLLHRARSRLRQGLEDYFRGEAGP
jgi:RNA polymerase sigma-70 factor (ECF subfamily)